MWTLVGLWDWWHSTGERSSQTAATFSEKWDENKMEVARSFRRLEKVEKATTMKNSRGCKVGKNESCPIVLENTNLQQSRSDCLLHPSIRCRGGKAWLD